MFLPFIFFGVASHRNPIRYQLPLIRSLDTSSTRGSEMLNISASCQHHQHAKWLYGWRSVMSFAYSIFLACQESTKLQFLTLHETCLSFKFPFLKLDQLKQEDIERAQVWSWQCDIPFQFRGHCKTVHLLWKISRLVWFLCTMFPVGVDWSLRVSVEVMAEENKSKILRKCVSIVDSKNCFMLKQLRTSTIKWNVWSSIPN